MAGNELRNQELMRHEEKVDRNIEHHQAMNLDEKKQGIATANQNSSTARIVNIVYFLFGALQLLLATRVILKLIAANPNNSFADFVYDLSAPFVGLFASLVQNPTINGEGTGVLEITTLLAMVAWAILAYLAGRLVWLMLSRPR